MSKYMMATKAHHLLGDVSRDEPDLCIILREDVVNYIGAWIEGFGFIDVEFPKETTRPLTQKEKDKYIGKWYGINRVPLFQMKKEDFE